MAIHALLAYFKYFVTCIQILRDIVVDNLSKKDVQKEKARGVRGTV